MSQRDAIPSRDRGQQESIRDKCKPATHPRSGLELFVCLKPGCMEQINMAYGLQIVRILVTITRFSKKGIQ